MSTTRATYRQLAVSGVERVTLGVCCCCAEVYLGCIDDTFWPGVPWRTYRHCAEDWVRGWVYDGELRPIVWCLCDDHDDCNVNISDAGSRPVSTLTTSTPATGNNRTTQSTTQVLCALPVRLPTPSSFRSDFLVFTARCTIVQNAVCYRMSSVRLFVCPFVCNVGGS